MPRRTRPQPDSSELNLAPIMNMVVILIPLLLLSVVFLKVGTINVSMPQLAPGPTSDPTEEPLNLTVAIAHDGFHLTTGSLAIAPRGSCPSPGPTICVKGAQVNFDNARKHLAEGDTQAGQNELDRGLAAYDWPALYSELARIKAEHEAETVVHVTADPDVPYAAIVRVMDVARFKLEKERYATASEFWGARYASGASGRAELFSDPILSIAR